MFARYSSIHHIVITTIVVLASALSLRAADQTITGNLTVTGNTTLQGVLDIGTAILPQGVTITGDSDLMGNIFTIGHGLNPDNITQNYGMAGLEIYIKNTNSTTRLIEQATTVDGTTFKWGTKAATDLNVNGILDDFGTQWMSLTGTTLTIAGNILGNGTDNQLTAQTLTGANSILTRGLGDARYVQLTSTVPLTITNATAATSSTTGALIISGGIGVAKDSWINGVRLGRGLAGVSSNTALGAGTLNTNTTGSNNTASGLNSLYANTTGANNSATGVNALRYNTTGGANTATGVSSLNANTTGSNNTGSGYQALKSNTIGGFNTVLGYNAANFHANGTTALTDPDGSVYIGAEVRAFDNNDSNSVVIAGRNSSARGVGEGANTTVLGNSATTSTKIFGALSQSGGTVTTSKPHNFTQTWNAGAITFTGLQSNITDTASAAGSLLLDLQVGGVSKFSVDKAGNVSSVGNLNVSSNLTVAGQPVLTQAAAATTYVSTTQADATYLSKTIPHEQDWSTITARPTTVLGYGITDALKAAGTSTELQYRIDDKTMGAIVGSSWDGITLNLPNFKINGVPISAGGGIYSNVAFGNECLKNNTTGILNVALGYRALYSNVTSNGSVAIGNYSASKTTALGNIAIGSNALYNNITGTYNVAIGTNALYSNSINSSVAIGQGAGGSTMGSNAIAIGASAMGEGDNTTVLGNSATTSTKIFGALSQSGGTVTTSKPHNFTQTWNAGAVVFTGLKSNITDTASAAGSLLLDLQVGGVSQFSVDKAGNIAANNLTVAGQSVLTQSMATSTYLTKATFDPDGDGKVDTAQLTGAAPLTIANATASTSNTTGALVVSGGVGVAKDAFINGLRVGVGPGALGPGNTVLGEDALNSNTVGNNNVAIGFLSLSSNTSGSSNISIGVQALVSSTAGFYNVAVGEEAMLSNTTGSENIAWGYRALHGNTTGNHNIASGSQALFSNTNGSNNIALGLWALGSNSTGSYNIAEGAYALNNNTTGNYNIASGTEALQANINGSYNIAVGYRALATNQTGSKNVATGVSALSLNDNGSYNTANGNDALYSNESGNYNTVVGYQSLYSNLSGNNNTAVGYAAGKYQADGATALTPNNSVYLGASSKGLDDADENAIVIGYQAIGEGANTTVIGNPSTTSAHIHGRLKVSEAEVSGQLIITNPAGGIDMGEFGDEP